LLLVVIFGIDVHNNLSKAGSFLFQPFVDGIAYPMSF